MEDWHAVGKGLRESVPPHQHWSEEIAPWQLGKGSQHPSIFSIQGIFHKKGEEIHFWGVGPQGLTEKNLVVWPTLKQLRARPFLSCDQGRRLA